MTIDAEVIERLVVDHPEAYRGGRIDFGRLREMVTVGEAWERASRCLADDNLSRAAYWTGFAKAAET